MAIITNITVQNTSTTNIYVNATCQTGGTRVRRVNWILNGLFDDYTTFAETTNASVYHTFSGLNPGQTYTLTASFLDPSGNEVGRANTTGTTGSNRPSNWSWVTSKSSGGNFNILASEWNSFFNRINQFRRYKGLSNYSFSTAYSGNEFMANNYNQARYAIGDMNPSTALPPIRYSGDTIYASEINRLRDSLNSIS